MAETKKNPDNPKAGIEQATTKVISHPLMKAITNPAMNMATVIIIVETFSPRAPWKANESVANLDDNSDWSIVSNHPIYCLSKLFK